MGAIFIMGPMGHGVRARAIHFIALPRLSKSVFFDVSKSFASKNAQARTGASSPFKGWPPLLKRWLVLRFRLTEIHAKLRRLFHDLPAPHQYSLDRRHEQRAEGARLLQGGFKGQGLRRGQFSSAHAVLQKWRFIAAKITAISQLRACRVNNALFGAW